VAYPGWSVTRRWFGWLHGIRDGRGRGEWRPAEAASKARRRRRETANMKNIVGAVDGLGRRKVR